MKGKFLNSQFKSLSKTIHRIKGSHQLLIALLGAQCFFGSFFSKLYNGKTSEERQKLIVV